MVMKREINVGNDENTPAINGGACGSESKYRGVRKRKWGKYVSEIRLPNSRERIWLGSYDSAEKAARAFDAATFCLRGRSAKLNFPDSPPDIPGARSLSRPEIQEAAARFAEEPTRVQDNPTRIGNGGGHEYEASHCVSETVTTGSTSVSAFSDGTVQFELGDHSDFLSDGGGGSYLDMLTTMGCGDYATDYGVFPTYDEYYSPELAFPGEDSVDGALTQESIFLWNF